MARGAASIVGAACVGAYVDKEREHDPVELVESVLGLTRGALGAASVARSGVDIALFAQGRRWVVSPELVRTSSWMSAIASMLNDALAVAGAPRRLYRLASGELALATLDQVDQLAHADLLGEDYDLPAERVSGLPLVRGSSARMHLNGRLGEGVLAVAHVIDGIPCAPGPIALGYHGGLDAATLARPHAFGGVELLAGTALKMWEQTEPGEPPCVCEATIATPFAFAGVEIPAATVISFAEDGGSPWFTLGEDTLELDPATGRWRVA